MGRALALSTLVLICSISTAGAHPHVFIEMTSAVVFNAEGKLKAINVKWVFDANYSEFATSDLDVNKDGVLTPEELHPLAKDNIEFLEGMELFRLWAAERRKAQMGRRDGLRPDYGQGRPACDAFRRSIRNTNRPAHRKVSLPHL